MAGELAICVCRKRSKQLVSGPYHKVLVASLATTTSRRPRSLSSKESMSSPGVSRIEIRASSRMKSLEMFLRTLQYFCASVLCPLNIIARFLYRQCIRGGKVKQIVIAYTSTAGRLMALFYFYIIVNQKRDE